MYERNYHRILDELEFVLSTMSPGEIDGLVNEILEARIVIVAGAGRVGMAGRGFAMRLGHLGLRAYSLGDSTLPSLGEGDLLVIASGSGETQTIYDVAQTAKQCGARLGLITGRRDSRMGRLADVVIEMKVPSKVQSVDGFSSIQPMTTLNEQSLQVLFDAIVLQLMAKTGETQETMWKRHSNLE